MSQPLIAITRRQALFFTSFLVLYEFLTYIANDMIMPGMIHVVASFHGQESAIASSLTAYVLGGASLQLFLGPLSDRFGRRPVMLAGALLFFVFTLFIAGSHSITQFLLARYFEGMGLCFIGVVGYATLQEIFAEMDAIRLIALVTNVASLAPLLGPLAGATFILYFNWRGIFLLIGILALIALWGLWRYMPESVGAIRKDGQLIAPTSLAPRAIINNYLQLLANPVFMLGTLVIALLGTPCIAWIAISPIIIVTDAKLSVIHYALWQLPIFGAGILGSCYLRKLTRSLTVKQIIAYASIIVSIGLTITFLLPLCIDSDFKWLMPGLCLYGFGMGMAAAPLNRLILFSTPVSKGTAYAMISMLSMCIQALGIEVGNHVYAHHQNSAFGFYCGILGLLYLVGLVSIFRLSRQSSSESASLVPAL